jgi:hypothetical protein
MTNPTHGGRISEDKAGAGQSPGKTNAKGAEMKRGGQVLSGIRHGGHVTEDKSPPAVELAAKREDITMLKDAVAGTAGAAAATAEPEEVLFKTPFDYLFPKLATDPAAHLPADDSAKIAAVVAGLKALGDAMVEDSMAAGEDPLQPTGNSTIPSVYTWFVPRNFLKRVKLRLPS